MIGGRDGEATEVIRVANSAASPLRYEMDPQGQYDALKAIEDDGDELLAIYHSHTKSAAYPSQTDVNQAVAWPEQVYLIVSLADAGRARRQGLPAQGPEDRRCRARRHIGTSGSHQPRRPWRRRLRWRRRRGRRRGRRRRRHAGQGRLRPQPGRGRNDPGPARARRASPACSNAARGFDDPEFLAAGPHDVYGRLRPRPEGARRARRHDASRRGEERTSEARSCAASEAARSAPGGADRPDDGPRRARLRRSGEVAALAVRSAADRSCVWSRSTSSSDGHATARSRSRAVERSLSRGRAIARR